MKTIFSFENVYSAYLICKKNKNKTVSHLEFAEYLEQNLQKLLEDLQNKTYKVGKFVCFVLEWPVIREVFAGQFRDRIVHHLLLNEIEEYFEKLFIFNSFACRKNKGAHLAVQRLQSGIQSLEDTIKNPSYFLQLDISAFFMSIDRQKLYEIFKKDLDKIVTRHNKSAIWEKDVLYLVKTIIFTDPISNYYKQGNLKLFDKVLASKSLFFVPSGKGLPIGNLTSQFFANIYLNQLDHFIKRACKCKYYYRYVDDFVILSESKDNLQSLVSQINNFLEEELALKLSAKKTRLQSSSKGIDFLGYFVRKKYLLVRNRVVKNFKNKEWRFNQNKLSLNEFNAATRSYFGHFKFAKSWRLKNKFTI